MSADPVPQVHYFSWQYALWLAWSNLITLLATAQMAVAALMLDRDIFSHTTFRYLVIANAVLTAVVAQVKKNNPVSLPPMKELK